MRITSLRIRVVAPKDFTFQWREDIPRIQNTMSVFEIGTDDGVTGVATSWLPASPTEIAEQGSHFFRDLLIGSDPLDRERLWQAMMAFSRYMVMPKSASLIDIALWDIAGKAFGLPVYKVLGAYRESIPAYATTETQESVQGYVQIALDCQRAGLAGVKLHAAASPDKDIEVCKAVREAVGDDYCLMLDATSAYDYQDALRVGRAIERLGFHWYEDPIRDDDVEGFVQLSRALDIPVLMGESNNRGPWALAQYLNVGAADAYRAVGDVIGGITGLRKIGDLCEAHNRRMEAHSYGSTLVQAAHLHQLLAAKNSEFFELPWPKGPLDFGMREVIEADGQGLVHAPTSPGLGFEVDWDAIDDATIAEFS